MSWFLSSLTPICVAVLIVFTMIHAVAHAWMGRSKNEIPVLAIKAGVAAATVPVGVALVVCAFSTEHVVRLSDAGIGLAVAGLFVILTNVIEALSFSAPDERVPKGK